MNQTTEHPNTDSFAEDFIEMLEINDSRLLHTHGLMIATGPYEIHLFTDELNEDANDHLIQLARNRTELLRNSLEAENFRSFIVGTRELAEWLDTRGIQVGLSAKTRFAKFKLLLFNWFPFMFGV